MVGRALLDKRCTMSTDGYRYTTTYVYAENFSIGRRKVAVSPLRLFAKNITPDNGRFFSVDLFHQKPPPHLSGCPTANERYTRIYNRPFSPERTPSRRREFYLLVFIILDTSATGAGVCAAAAFFPLPALMSRNAGCYRALFTETVDISRKLSSRASSTSASDVSDLNL